MVLFVQIIIEIPQLLDAVPDVPVVRVVQVLTGVVVEETVELPRLHSLRNSSSGSAHHHVDELTGCIFMCPAHRCRAGGCVHRDTAPIISCILGTTLDRHGVF